MDVILIGALSSKAQSLTTKMSRELSIIGSKRAGINRKRLTITLIIKRLRFLPPQY
jgi:hypothetical protein